MQERFLQIKSMNRPGAGNNQREHGVDHGQLDHRAEGLIIVGVVSLGVKPRTKDPASLVPFQRAIEVEFVLENPFVSDDVAANGARDKIPGAVSNQGNKLFFHGTAPVWIDEGGADGGGYRRQG
jgi:hypothetical protein